MPTYILTLEPYVLCKEPLRGMDIRSRYAAWASIEGAATRHAALYKEPLRGMGLYIRSRYAASGEGSLLILVVFPVWVQSTYSNVSYTQTHYSSTFIQTVFRERK